MPSWRAGLRNTAATAGRANLEAEIHELNGQPVLIFYDEHALFAALLLAIAHNRIHRVFFMPIYNLLSPMKGEVVHLGYPATFESN